MILALLAALAAPDPGPALGPIRTFTDWEVACDNLHECEATSLMREDDDTDGPFDGSFRVSIARAAGPGGALSVTVDISGSGGGMRAIRIDGRSVARADAGDGEMRFAGNAAAAIVAAMAKGHTLELVDSNGAVLATASLAGASAMLRFIDAEQGRTGTTSATVATGTRSARTVPAPPAVPRFAALRAGKAPPAAIGPALKAAMAQQVECEAPSDTLPSEVTTVALGGGATLALLPCGSGAYNFETVPFLVRGGKAVPARFDHADSLDDGKSFLLTNADWDSDQNLLTSHAKGRGLGDCGESASYAWDGAGFRAVEIRQMRTCRGSLNWLRIWIAEPLFR